MQFDLEGWRRMSAWRAENSLLADPDVRSVIDGLVADGEFDPLLSGSPRVEKMRGVLQERAVAALLAEGRDPDRRGDIATYVQNDLWARYPPFTADYDEQIRAFEARGYIRQPPTSNSRDRETLGHRALGWFGSGVDQRDAKFAGIPAGIELERHRGYVFIGTKSWSPGVPGDRRHPPRFSLLWSALTSGGTLVELDEGALHPGHVHPEVLEMVHYLALAFEEWQRTLNRDEYNARRMIGDLGPDSLPPRTTD